MDEELKGMQETWQGGVPADIEIALRSAAMKADRSNRWGRWLLLALLPLLLLLILVGLVGWLGIVDGALGIVESAILITAAAAWLALGVITLLRWPQRRLGRAAPSSIKDAIAALLDASNHRLWLWAGWLQRAGWLIAIIGMLALPLAGLLVPRWDLD